MLYFICRIARQHHKRYEEVYVFFQSNFDSFSFRDVVASFRHQLTGGIHPTKRDTAEQQRGDLLKTNVIRVIHEMYCQLKEVFPHLPSFNSRVEEKFSILVQRAKRHNAEVEKQ